MTWTPSDDEHFHGENLWESPDEPVDLAFFMVPGRFPSFSEPKPGRSHLVFTCYC
jgi:hypothetical protein